MTKNNNPPVVLLVEDNMMAAKIATMLLEKSGCLVDWVGTGKEAIEKSQGEYRFILLDLGLPDTDGYTVAESIRHQKNNTPIIALSAHSDDKHKEEAIASGMNAFLSKPLTDEKCFELLETFCKR